MRVVLGSAMRAMVPFAVTPDSGVSLKINAFVIGEDEALEEAAGVGEGEGEGVAADPPPQAIAQTATTATTNHALGITAAGYWSGPEFQPGPLPVGGYARQGRGTRRHRRNKNPSTRRTRNGPIAPRPVTT